MSEIEIMTQSTPNPDALKFVLNREVIADGKATFNTEEDCSGNLLARDLISLDGVDQVHFFENVITISKSDVSWRDLEPLVKSVIMTRMPVHDSDFNAQKESHQKKKREELSPELKKVEEILDQTVRMGLQADGGDIEVVELKDNKLFVRYEGACGTCPSATTGTLYAIEGILRDQFHPEIMVIPVDMDPMGY